MCMAEVDVSSYHMAMDDWSRFMELLLYSLHDCQGI